MRGDDRERAHVFVVRVTAGTDAGGLRGHVRDGATDAYRAFTAWHELTEFLADQIDGTVCVDERPASGRPSMKERR